MQRFANAVKHGVLECLRGIGLGIGFGAGVSVFTAGVGAVVAGPALLTLFPPVIAACGGGAAIAASFTFGAAGLVQGARDGFTAAAP
ncbi:MAG: hypothetical protein KF760_30870 [Candidatus Eremiobacteraeota bacterium]|nr:hypothetical protein [Candidatus Eremiobacteraeota bacterium]MCW5872322.1 hypothetical protein [Candidatus Eremiobacteraeota bacterium]